MANVNPYLTFNGNCEEVFNFYKSVFGGEFITLMRNKEVPAEMGLPESEGNKIMHVALPIGKGSVLMGSDRLDSYGEIKIGQNFTISLQVDSEQEANRLFNGLSAGGRVTMPLEATFWNAYFGMFVDKFGLPWMVNYDYK